MKSYKSGHETSMTSQDVHLLQIKALTAGMQSCWFVTANRVCKEIWIIMKQKVTYVCFCVGHQSKRKSSN